MRIRSVFIFFSCRILLCVTSIIRLPKYNRQSSPSSAAPVTPSLPATGTFSQGTRSSALHDERKIGVGRPVGGRGHAPSGGATTDRSLP